MYAAYSWVEERAQEAATAFQTFPSELEILGSGEYGRSRLLVATDYAYLFE